MGPASTALLVLLIIACLALLTGVTVYWAWIGRRVLLRILTLVLVVSLALATVAVGVNRQYALYPRWSDLFGGESATHAAGAEAGNLDEQASRAAGGQIRSVVLPLSITGIHSRITLPGQVYVPAAYLEPQNRNKDFPVIEVLNPYPGSPDFYTKALEVPRLADEAIAAGQLPPTLIVIPQQNPVPGKDSECLNQVGGPQVETFLTADLQEFMRASFRVRRHRQAWAMMGFSTGGYCAVNLLLRHPETYSAAVSFSGLLTVPTNDAETGDLFKGDQQARRENDPQWTVANWQFPPIYFWLHAGKDDPDVYRTSTEFAAKLKPPIDKTTVFRDTGGHAPNVIKTLLPHALDAVGDRLLGPIKPSSR